MRHAESILTARAGAMLAAAFGLFAAVVFAVPAEGGAANDSALPELSADASVMDLVAFAVTHNPSVRAAQSRWQAAEQGVGLAGSLPDPRLSAGYHIEAVETRVGPQRWRLALTQTIPWIRKLGLQREAAVHAAAVEQERLLARQQQLGFKVKEAYYELAYLHRAIAITSETVELLSHQAEVALARYVAGGAQQAAAIGIQLEQEQVGDRLARLRDNAATTGIHLNVLLGRPAEAALPVPRLPEVAKTEFSPFRLRASLRDQNPRLRALDRAQARANTLARLAGQSYFPDVTLGIQYIDTDKARHAEVDDSGKDPVIATLAINLPLRFGKYRAAKEQAEHQHAAARAEQLDLTNRLTVELEAALAELEGAHRRMALYQGSLIPLATQSQEVTLRAFSGGTLGFTELIAAHRALFDLRLALARARADYGTGAAQVAMLVGEGLGDRRSAAAPTLSE